MSVSVTLATWDRTARKLVLTRVCVPASLHVDSGAVWPVAMAMAATCANVRVDTPGAIAVST